MQNQTHLIKLLREKTGYDQKNFAKKLNTSPSRISEYENNKFDISLNKFLKWCEVFEIDPEMLFKDVKEINN